MTEPHRDDELLLGQVAGARADSLFRGAQAGAQSPGEQFTAERDEEHHRG